MSDFISTLNLFKSKEQIESLLAILHDKTLQDVMIAWQNMKVSFNKEIENIDNLGDHERWDLLWSNSKWDSNLLSTLCGLGVNDTNRAILRLKGLRLIYPDGTISTSAAQYMRTEVKAIIQKNLGTKTSK